MQRFALLAAQPFRNSTSQSIFRVALTKPARFYSDKSNGNASIVLDHGVPILNLSHKSTNRVFTLLPGESVESLANSIQKEFGLEKAKVSFSTQQNGALLAGSSDVRLLSKLPVSLHLGESKLNVDVSKPAQAAQVQQIEKISPELISTMKKFYNTIDSERLLDSKRESIETQLIAINSELAPLQSVKEKLDKKAAASTNTLAWFGISAMAFQFGVLAQLTWFEYSWDIVEPITYFVTYAAVIGGYSYYVVTKSNYEFTGVRERKWLQILHSGRKAGLDVEKYNTLRKTAADLEARLAQIKELQHH